MQALGAAGPETALAARSAVLGICGAGSWGLPDGPVTPGIQACPAAFASALWNLFCFLLLVVCWLVGFRFTFPPSFFSSVYIHLCAHTCVCHGMCRGQKKPRGSWFSLSLSLILGNQAASIFAD